MKKNREEIQQEGEAPVKSRRKTVYYIVLAACALVLIAAITLTVVFVTRDSGVSIEQPNPDDGKDDETPDDPDEPDQPSDTEPVFSLPVQSATLGTTYTFWHNQTLNRYCLHTGIDFKAEAGTQVTAAYAGTVESITDTLLEGGKVVIDHGNGLKTEYASIDVASGLKVGDAVTMGQAIGTVSAAADAMGNEFAEGSHLHFEVLENGESIDPAAYLDYDEK